MKTPREVEDLQMALRAVDYQLQTHPNDISLLSEKTGLLRALNTETTIDPKTAQEIEDLETALRTVDYELGEYPRDSSLLAEKVRLLKATSVELACEVPEVKPAVKPPAAETAVSRPSPIGDTTETDGKRQYLRDRENSYLPELTLFTPSAVARLVAAALLVLALGRLPYGFYQLLRLVVCGVSAYSAYTANKSGQVGWTWLLGLIALLFNPFVPLYLSYVDWLPIDLLVAVVLLVSVGFVREHTASRAFTMNT